MPLSPLTPERFIHLLASQTILERRDESIQKVITLLARYTQVVSDWKSDDFQASAYDTSLHKEELFAAFSEVIRLDTSLIGDLKILRKVVPDPCRPIPDLLLESSLNRRALCRDLCHSLTTFLPSQEGQPSYPPSPSLMETDFYPQLVTFQDTSSHFLYGVFSTLSNTFHKKEQLINKELFPQSTALLPQDHSPLSELDRSIMDLSLSYIHNTLHKEYCQTLTQENLHRLFQHFQLVSSCGPSPSPPSSLESSLRESLEKELHFQKSLLRFPLCSSVFQIFRYQIQLRSWVLLRLTFEGRRFTDASPLLWGEFVAPWKKTFFSLLEDSDAMEAALSIFIYLPSSPGFAHPRSSRRLQDLTTGWQQNLLDLHEKASIEGGGSHIDIHNVFRNDA